MSKEKKVYLEILRLISLFGVIFVHTAWYGYFLYSLQTETKFVYCINMVASCMAKTCVPVFFMISGILLIPKEESIKELYIKRVARTCLILILISAFYCILYNHMYPEQGKSIADFFSVIYAQEYITPLWFMYSYLAILILLPFLRKIALAMSTKEYYYLFVIALVYFYVIGFLNFFMNSELNLSLFIVERNILYVLLGYFMEYQLHKEQYNKKGCILLGSFTVISIIFSGIMTYLEFLRRGEYNETFIGRFEFIPTIFVLYIVVYLFKYKKPIDSSSWKGKILVYFGSCTFCGYLFEEFFRIKYISIYDKLGGYIHPFLIFPIYALAVFLSAVLVSSILKVLPVVKKLGL